MSILTVNTIAARNAIASGDRTDGMAVHVLEVGGVFHLRGGTTNAYWVGPNEWETTAITTIYVNGGTGNDATGTGAVGAPYATIDRAYKDVPFLLRHPVQIKIASGTYTSFPEYINNECEGNGQLVFDGGDISDDEGSKTVNTITAVNVLAAQDINVSGASWTPDEFKGKFIKITSGTNSGYYLGIISNTADTIRVVNSRKMPSAGNTFIIGTAPVTINFSGTDNVNIRVFDRTFIQASDYQKCRFGLGFVDLNSGSRFIVRDTAGFFHCCDINFSNQSFIAINSEINTPEPFPDTSNAFAESGANDYGVNPLVTRSGATTFSSANVSTFLGFDDYTNISALGASFQRSHIDRAYVQRGAKANFLFMHFGVSAQKSIEALTDGFVYAQYCHFQVGTNCIDLNAARAVISSCTSTSANYTYGISLKNGSKAIDNSTPAISGSTNDIYFYQTDAASAYPAAGSWATDSQGSYFIHER